MRMFRMASGAVSWPNVPDQATASGRRRSHDRCHPSRCLHPFCSPWLVHCDSFAQKLRSRIDYGLEAVGSARKISVDCN